MTDALVTIAREYLEDSTAPYSVSDTIIERILNISRKPVYSLALYAEDDDGKIFNIGVKYIMGLSLSDGTNNITTGYNADVFNGIITFTAKPATPVYASFTYHDFFNAVAEMWKYRAAQSRFSGRVKLGDEDLPEDKNSREYCIGKYWAFRTGRTIQSQR